MVRRGEILDALELLLVALSIANVFELVPFDCVPELPRLMLGFDGLVYA